MFQEGLLRNMYVLYCLEYDEEGETYLKRLEWRVRKNNTLNSKYHHVGFLIPTFLIF